MVCTKMKNHIHVCTWYVHGMYIQDVYVHAYIVQTCMYMFIHLHTRFASYKHVHTLFNCVRTLIYAFCCSILIRQACWPAGWSRLLPGYSVTPIQVQAHEFNWHQPTSSPFYVPPHPCWPLQQGWQPVEAPPRQSRRPPPPFRRGGGGGGGGGESKMQSMMRAWMYATILGLMT